MLHRALAIRYAQALFTLAEKAGGHDQQMAELIKAQTVLAQNPPLKKAIESPTVAAQVKKSILKRLLEKRLDPTTLHLLYVLVDKSREVYVEPIVEGYRELLRQQRGEIEVTIQSAAPLTEATFAQLQKTLLQYTGRKVELKTEVDPELLGGLVIVIGDRVIDGSIRRQLTQIQERLTKVTTATVGG